MAILRPSKINRDVFNNTVGSPYSFDYPKLSDKEANLILAGLFEQLLVFDKITISTNRVNFSLYFLIQKIGFDKVERLLDSGYINFMIWSPVLVTGTGTQLKNGTIDESVIYKQPPLAAGSISDEDLDPEKNISLGLSNFPSSKVKKKSFVKKAIKRYIIPNGMEFSTGSAKLVIDAYKNNSLQGLGLPYEKEPNELDLNQRKLLFDLGHKVLETAVLSKYSLKSYENYGHYETCKKNLENIGKAYHISDNTSEILRMENLPNLKELYLQNRLDFNSVFKIRHLSTAKYYRKWINEVGENSNCQEVTSEYLKEIKGTNRFIETNDGKIVKNMLSFGASTALGAILAGPLGATFGGAAGFGLSLLESLVIDGILKGKSPSMFIDDLKKEINN